MKLTSSWWIIRRSGISGRLGLNRGHTASCLFRSFQDYWAEFSMTKQPRLAEEGGGYLTPVPMRVCTPRKDFSTSFRIFPPMIPGFRKYRRKAYSRA